MVNPVVHFEVPFDNKERVQQFYQKVFGLQFGDMFEMDYLIARSVK